MDGDPEGIEAITRDLHALGVASGDTVMVHASLRRLGPVAGRAEGVVRAFETAVGPDGTLMMVLGAANDWAWVNDRAEEDRPALLAEAVPFDHLTTPAEADVGILAEVFRRLPGTVASRHPEGRFAARGRLALWLTENVPWHDYYGRGSPLARFVDAGGRVLRLGADPDTVTVLHYAEYLANLSAKRRVRRYRRVIGDDGVETRFVDSLDDSHGIVDYAGPDYFGEILLAYLDTGAARRGHVGHAMSELIEAADLVEFGVAWMEAHLTA